MASLRSKGLHFALKHLASKLLSTNLTPQTQRSRLAKIGFSFWRSFKYSCDVVLADGVPSEWVVAEGAKEERVLLYFHGGAYTFGSPRSYNDITAGLSHFCRTKVLAVDYRLAPENPYPAALDDSMNAYKWLLKEGYKPENIVIGGDSAGGGLALALLLNLRDQGEALPAAGVCFSPWVDLSCEADSYTSLEKLDPLLSAHWLHEMAKLYVRDENIRNPYISPLYADFKGLPPIMIQVGSDEVLLDDSINLKKRLREDGVEVSLKAYDGMWHVWQLYAAIIPEGKEALIDAAEFIEATITAASLVSDKIA